MRVLFLSRFGESFGIAMKLVEEGHDISFYIHDPKYRSIGRGFVNPKRVDKIDATGVDLILVDTTGIGNIAESLSRSHHVIGGSVFADKIEKDREYAQKIMKKYTQASLPMYQSFTSIKDGIKFLEEHGKDKTFCFKPNNMPTEWTFVPSGNSENGDATEAVISVMNIFPHQKWEFILQERVDGIEISTEGWFDGREFIPESFNHTMESKRFMEGDKGRNVGCMGNIIWAAGENDELVDILIKPLKEVLAVQKYKGPIDVNAKVTRDKAFFLEFTPRFGYDSMPTWMAMQANKTDWLYNMGRGMKVPQGFGIGVRLTLSPYPYSEDISHAAAHLQGLAPISYTENVWPMDVMMKDGEPCIAGTSAIIGVVSAQFSAIEGCRQRAYREIDRIKKTDDLQYRSDIGEDAQDKINILKEWGWV